MHYPASRLLGRNESTVEYKTSEEQSHAPKPPTVFFYFRDIAFGGSVLADALPKTQKERSPARGAQRVRTQLHSK